MANKKLTLAIEALDQFTQPFKDLGKSTRGYSKIAKKVADQQRNLNKKVGDISSYKKLDKQLKETSYKKMIASRRSVELAKKINSVKRPTAAMTSEFKRAKQAEDKLKRSHINQSEALKKLNADLKKSKVNTDNLTGAQKKLAREQRSINRKMKIGKAIDKTKSLAKSGLSKAGTLAKRGALAGAGALGIGGYLFKTQLLDTAALFEKFETVLKTLEGSSEKARSSMAWIQEFGATTPYEIEGVTAAFVKMRSYGLDPTNGSLRTLGDTAAAMDKDLIQAVEAMADAVTGENERLKEFGIKARAEGENFLYEYTENGKTMTKTAKKNSREQIQATLLAIFNDKYKGSMDELSKTWGGMMSNLGDQWTNFKILVMKSGLFDRMKDQLGSLLDKINAMAASGELEKLAVSFGGKLVDYFDQTKETAIKIVKAIDKISKMLDGMDRFFESPLDTMFGPSKEQQAFDKKYKHLNPDRYGVSEESRRREKRRKEKLEANRPPKTFPVYYGIEKMGDYKPKGQQVAKQTKVENKTVNTIHVHPSAGMDETQLAQKTADEIERRQANNSKRMAYDYE